MCPRAVPLKAPITAIVDFFFSQGKKIIAESCASQKHTERELSSEEIAYILYIADFSFVEEFSFTTGLNP